jgi:hypothetical protein
MRTGVNYLVKSGRGQPIMKRMTRRLPAILLLCASLFGLAQTAMACVSTVSPSDCCSGDPGSGCTTDTMPVMAVDGGSCCLATPAASTASLVAPLRSVDLFSSGGGPASPAIAARFDHRASPCVRSISAGHGHDAPCGADATLTYLYTARLRL